MCFITREGAGQPPHTYEWKIWVASIPLLTFRSPIRPCHKFLVTANCPNFFADVFDAGKILNSSNLWYPSLAIKVIFSQKINLENYFNEKMQVFQGFEIFF